MKLLVLNEASLFDVKPKERIKFETKRKKQSTHRWTHGWTHGHAAGAETACYPGENSLRKGKD